MASRMAVITKPKVGVPCVAKCAPNQGAAGRVGFPKGGLCKLEIGVPSAIKRPYNAGPVIHPVIRALAPATATILLSKR
jgi:hypothetical protein